MAARYSRACLDPERAAHAADAKLADGSAGVAALTVDIEEKRKREPLRGGIHPDPCFRYDALQLVAMFDKIRKWRVRRIVARRPIAESLWKDALRRCPAAQRLGASDQATLRVLATLFLESKSLEPVQGLELGDADRVLLAAHACIPILKLGLDWYDGWHSIIVYPDAFIPRRTQTDAAGVVHQTNTVMAGEAWGRGPVILSWADVLSGKKPGHNVVIHEMAHKLDLLNGDANGFPPLHRRMDRRVWSRVFSSAWDRLKEDQRNGVELPIDPYALESPAEFFAVASEQFFETPATLREHLPDVYRQLEQFYRQHPF
ncbi:zinc-dependent peptidase [Rhodanobacter panaciterrae]|nr:M90 family metallopeptidase [Rhodanobacter panaciterrae]